MDDGEQIVALQAPTDCFGVRDRHHGIGVPHDDGVNRRVESTVGEDVAEPAHVQPSRLSVAEQVGSGEGLVVDQCVVVGADAPRQSATAVRPGADEGRQHGHGPVEHRPVVMVLGADEGADRRRARRAVVRRQSDDLRRVESAHLTGTFGRPLGDVCGELGEPHRVGGDPDVVRQAVADQDVHHRQHQGDVGAR